MKSNSLAFGTSPLRPAALVCALALACSPRVGAAVDMAFAESVVAAYAGVVTNAHVAGQAGATYLEFDFTLHAAPGSSILCRMSLPPKEKWDGRLWGHGHGGYAGNVWSHPSPEGPARVQCDMGTGRATDGRKHAPKVMNDEEWRDFGWRATHLMTVCAKRICAAYYGRPPERAYFRGGSSGGGQAMHEATRFPGDYDGVIAIVPAMGRLSIDAARFQNFLALSKDGQMLLTTNQLKIVSDAAVAFMADKDEAYCAGRYLSDPRMCDPYAEEILDLAAKKDPVFADADIRRRVLSIYAGTVVDGQRVYHGYPWGALITYSIGSSFFQTYLNGRPGPKVSATKATWADFLAFAREKEGDLDALGTDLAAFAARGGKILATVGFEDQTVTFPAAMQHWEETAERMGSVEKTRAFYHMYFQPGAAHGGKGRATRALIGYGGELDQTLMDWVEKGVEPGDLVIRTDQGDTIHVAPYPEKAYRDASGEWRRKPALRTLRRTTYNRRPPEPVKPLVDAASRWDAQKGLWNPNTDESKVEPYKLEDPLVSTNGWRVECPADWPERRLEILDIFAKKIYGEEPPPPKALAWDLLSEKTSAGGYAIRRVFRMSFTADKSGPSVVWAMWIPRPAAKKGKVPVILGLTYRGVHELVTDDDLPICRGWARENPQRGVVGHRATEKTRGRMQDQNNASIFPLQMILARGYAVMCASYTEVSPDPSPYGRDGVDQYPFATTNGVFALWGPRDETRDDNITALGAWAWALSRGLDLAAKQPEIDARRSVVTGCSRLGKAAFLAAARDARFAVCVPNQCGGGGVCLAKRDYGENVSTENSNFAHWYCKAYRRYSKNPAELLDFDMHLLLASIAPRRVLVEGFGPNDWMDTKGEYLAAVAASPAWSFLGVPGLPPVGYPDYYETSAIGPYLGYVRRTEGHGISGYDWTWLLDFADAAWKAPYPVQRRLTRPFWYKMVAKQQRQVRAARGRTVDLVLIGDSLTWNWEVARGRDVFAELTNRYSVVNIGVAGDRVEEIEWRCRNGQLDGYRARYAMVLAGTNNIGRETPEEVAARHVALLDAIALRQPGAKLIVMAPFPVGNAANAPHRAKCAALKRLLRDAAARRGALWMDFDAKLLEPDGSISKETMDDGVHIGPKGYRFWLDELVRIVGARTR